MVVYIIESVGGAILPHPYLATKVLKDMVTKNLISEKNRKASTTDRQKFLATVFLMG